MINEIETIDAVNLTPHAMTIEADDGFKIVIPPSGSVARCATEEEDVKTVFLRGYEGHPITVRRTRFGAPSGVPEAEDAKVFLTSTLVREAAKRDDCLAPGKAIRGEDGQVVGAKGFAVSIPQAVRIACNTVSRSPWKQ